MRGSYNIWDVSKPNRSKGFGVPSIVAMTCIAGIWTAVTAGLVMTSYNKVAEYRYWSVVRSSAEAGLDYVVANLNQSYSAGISSSYDDLVADGVPHTSQLPSGIFSNGVAIQVVVNNVAPDTSSSVYDPTLDPPEPVGTGGESSLMTSNEWRIVQATASYAGLSKSIRVVLRPMYESTGSLPMMPYAVFANGLLNGSGNMRTDSYNSEQGPYGGSNLDNYNGSIASNTRIDLSGNTVIGGNAYVSSLPKGSTTALAATRSGNAVIKNQLKVNGITSGFTAQTGPSPGSNDHVQATEFYAPPTAVRTGDYTTPIDVSLSQSQTSLVSAPSAPVDSYAVGSISVSGNGRLIVRNGATAPSSSINVSANNTVYIPPGNYKASSLNVSGNGQIIVESGVSTPTKIYLEGNSAGSTVAQISGNGVANNTSIPARFQVVTNSSKNISVSGNGNFYGVIYSPSANISVNGNGHIYGAIAGNNATISGNAMLHYDKALLDPTYAASVGLSYSTTPELIGFKTISWQEMSP
jgi:hypothetical protein